MYLVVNIAGSSTLPNPELHNYFAVTFLNQTQKQPFHPESGCARPFKFFVHEKTIIEEELVGEESPVRSQLRTIVKITYSTSPTGNTEIGERLVGWADFSLRDLLRQPIQGAEFAGTLVDEFGSPVAGAGGAPFQAIISFSMQPLEGDELQVDRSRQRTLEPEPNSKVCYIANCQHAITAPRAPRRSASWR